ncbi:MAG: hypothetical protein ACR2NY_01155 [Alphaproteobacteria bacterium]
MPMQSDPKEFLKFYRDLHRHVLEKTYHATKGVVQAGPFKNMKIHPQFANGFGDTAGRLMGFYEDYLYPTIETALNHRHDIMLNVGCAEGYYGVGWGMRKPETPIVLIDKNPKAINIAIENAKLNHVNNYVVSEDSSPQAIENFIKHKTAPFVLVDIEGGEEALLSLSAVPSLQTATILVESHECFVAGITQRMIQNLSSSHDAKIISQKGKDPYLDITKDWQDLEKLVLCDEGRPSTMEWIYFTPKK